MEDKQSVGQSIEKPVETRDLLEIVENSMAEFNEAMRKREELSIRIGRRTTQIVRVGAVTVGLLSLAVLYLTAALKDDMSKMSEQMTQITGFMQTMSVSVNAVPVMSASVQDMNVLMQDMASSIRAVPAMTTSVQRMNILMQDMASSIGAVPVMSTSVQRMSADMTAMNNQIHFLNRNVGNMGYNVDRMASPMKMFPFP